MPGAKLIPGMKPMPGMKSMPGKPVPGQPEKHGPGPKRGGPPAQRGPKPVLTPVVPPKSAAPPPPVEHQAEMGKAPKPEGRPGRRIIGLHPKIAEQAGLSFSGRPSRKRPGVARRPPRRVLGVRRPEEGEDERADSADSAARTGPEPLSDLRSSWKMWRSLAIPTVCGWRTRSGQVHTAGPVCDDPASRRWRR